MRGMMLIGLGLCLALSTSLIANDEATPAAAVQSRTLVLGNEEYHAELVIRPTADKVTVLLRDQAAQHAVTIPAESLRINTVLAGKPQQFLLIAKPLPREAAGTSSRFELVSPELIAAIQANDPRTRLTVPMGERMYCTPITATAAHHDHAH
jgi:hypothetical protein